MRIPFGVMTDGSVRGRGPPPAPPPSSPPLPPPPAPTRARRERLRGVGERGVGQALCGPPSPSLFCCFVRRGLHLQSDVAQFSRLLPRTQFIKEIEILFGQFLRSRSLWRVRAHFCAGAHCTFGRVSSIARRHRERERDRERDIYRERERALLGSIHNGGSRALRPHQFEFSCSCCRVLLGEERGKSLLAAPLRRREG